MIATIYDEVGNPIHGEGVRNEQTRISIYLQKTLVYTEMVIRNSVKRYYYSITRK